MEERDDGGRRCTPRCFALWLLVLSVRVIQQRRAAHVSLGAGGDMRARARDPRPGELHRVRADRAADAAHPELARILDLPLHLLGITLLVGRLLHGYAFAFSRPSPIRTPFYGAVLTFVVLAIEAVLCLYRPGAAISSGSRFDRNARYSTLGAALLHHLRPLRRFDFHEVVELLGLFLIGRLPGRPRAALFCMSGDFSTFRRSPCSRIWISRGKRLSGRRCRTTPPSRSP